MNQAPFRVPAKWGLRLLHWLDGGKTKDLESAARVSGKVTRTRMLNLGLFEIGLGVEATPDEVRKGKSP